MGTAGIQKALVTGVEIVTTYGSSVIVELKGEVKNFTAYIDHSCLGRNTKNPENTINSVKWFLVREHVWTQFRKLHSELSKESFFDVLKNELRPSDYQIFEGNNLQVKKEMLIGNSPVGNLGVIFMLMPYSNYPESEIKNIFITALEKPQVLYAQFHFPKGGYIPLENNEKKAAYGQTIDVEIYTHLLPNWRNRVETFDCKLELINRGKVMATSESNIIENRGNFHYNNRKTVKFLLDIEWQKQHQNKGGNEEFYIRLSGYESSKGSVFRNPDIPLAEGSYDSQSATDDWTTLENGKWVYHISRVLFVPFDTFSELVSQFETEKKNQIQYIGDIRYTKKEFDPCGYSKITIKEDADTKRAPFVIFDEDDATNPIDRTFNIFSVIAGDKRKNISIILDNLKTNDTFCQGLLLPSGEKHTDRENVFQVNTVIPALRNRDGSYSTVEDPTQSGDRDVQPDNSRSPSRDVSDVQQWVEGKDYTIESDEKIVLMLRYMYNKTYENEVIDYLYGKQDYLTGGIFSDNVKNLWVVRYLLKWIKNDDIAQTYFLPISTCRYPNQIAKIKVLPDMKWVINFNYNIKTPLYYNATTPMIEHYSGFNEGKINTTNNNNRKEILNKKISNGLQHYVGRKTTFGLYVECEVSGKDDVIKVGGEFGEKFREMCAPLFWMVETLDNDLGISMAEKENSRLISSPATKKGLLGRLKTLPMSFELNPPQLGFGIGIGYGLSEKGIITYELDARFIADPIIGATVKLDLLALGSKFKPWGAVIDALDIASWLINAFSGDSIEFNYELYFQLTAKINIVGPASEDGVTKPSSITYNFEDKKITKGGISLQGYLEGKFVMSASLQYKVLIEKGKQVSIKDDEEKRRKAFELGIWVEGKAIVTLTLGKNFGKKNDWDADFYFSGVTLDFKIKAGGFNKEGKDQPITPKINKKINIFKNEGEIK